MRQIQRILILFYLISLVLGCACAVSSQNTSGGDPQDQRYTIIRTILDREGRHIDYDDLTAVYQKMVAAPDPIPRTDALLVQLIRQRNEDPRVDQMVLIFAAEIIGKSKHPIPDAQALFEQILQDDSRISHWVLVYVGRAIGNYPVDLPGGGELVDRIEAHQARLDADTTVKEYFGVHFLPPPRTQRIKAYLSGIPDAGRRGSERRAYYILIQNKVAEERVAAALDYLQSRNHPDASEASARPMRYMVQHWSSLQKALDSAGGQP